MNEFKVLQQEEQLINVDKYKCVSAKNCRGNFELPATVYVLDLQFKNKKKILLLERGDVTYRKCHTRKMPVVKFS